MLPQSAKQLGRRIHMPFEPAHLSDRRIQLGAGRNFFRRCFEVVARQIGR
jgi:hypothetical protein